MKQSFYSNGKLLITGEYSVLDGAKALALPTKSGQYLHVSAGKNQMISWKSFDADGSIWFEDTILFDDVKRKTSFDTSQGIKNTLIEILHQAYLQNNDFLDNSEGFNIVTELTFPRFWGLGTSSTLINNIAQWLKIDAFELLRKSFGGSGYDIACAQNDTPILYCLENDKPIVAPVQFNPAFADNLYFVYLNQKQNSKEAIAFYSKKRPQMAKIIEKIDAITNIVINTESLLEFSEALNFHEITMSHVLEMQTVKEAFFSDFTGTVKSLGAWGGDFVLAISEENPTPYFQTKGFSIVVPYRNMIK
ncbi:MULTISPECIES: GYDIA family GHMP kinase [Flavobacterium]|uniref:GYDIA family GHMP kinase n=1 Tax=Flavobacterium TaxID=237 RepID=UPI001FCA7878|nr:MULTISPECIES: GYDIA family GHMP kinase [Flavobacterium]UOK43510.1 GHMP kinase [Flavobacterium enshiense]